MGYYLKQKSSGGSPSGACFHSLRLALRGILLCVLSWMLVLPYPLFGSSAQAALFGSFGVKDEQELGRKFDILVRSRMPLVEDPEIRGYIQSLVDRLSKAFPPQPFPFHANVLLHNSLNAFAVPGGSVFVHTGLIMQLEHESELAGVLAHELAHVTQRHIATRIERAQAVTLLSLVGMLAGAFLGGGGGGGALMAGSMAAGQSAMLNYSRVDETEADQMGLQYLVAAGYAPQGMRGAFEKIRRKQWASGIDIPEYLSTHPDVGGRINEIQARIQSLSPAIQARKENDTRFLRVQTLVWARYGEPEAAARLFATQLKKQPGNSLAIMGQAILADRKNQIPEASALFQKALALSPDDALILRETGRFYYRKGDVRALDTLKRALARDPRDIMAQFYYARVLDDAKDRAAAHTYYKELLRYLPEDSEIHYVYGRSLGESGDPFNAYIHLAYSAIYQNDVKKAESWSKKAGSLARNAEDKKAVQRLDAIIVERKAIILKSF